MESLERYPLSVILSFLLETEGTCLLLTKRRYALQLLPIFRLPLVDSSGLVPPGDKNKKRKQQRRHRFIPVPVQDPSTLLDRLNTKRLFHRKPPKSDMGCTCAEKAKREWSRMRDEATWPTWYPPSLELLRFLDNESELYNIKSTVLTSYPRSGNTLVRTLLERITGYVTGSDTRPDRNLSRELAERHDLVGEGVTHSSLVRVIKTHWPERSGNAWYTAHRAVLLVRNPYDAIDSYWNMNATCTHTKTLTEAVYDQFRDKFEGLVRNEIDMWLKFHDYWINQSTLPVLIIRYEDLVQDTPGQMTRILKFILDQRHLSSFWKQRIRHVTGESVDKLGSYQPRSGSQLRFGKSLRKGHIDGELVEYIHKRSAENNTSNYLSDFGYNILKDGFPENFTFSSPPELPTHLRACVNRSGSVRINGSPAIRPKDCPFGRSLQKWRYSVTNTDKDPLPTVGA